MLALRRRRTDSARSTSCPASSPISSARDGPIVEIRLDCNGEALIGPADPPLGRALGLTPGTPAYAVIKSIAFDHHALAGAPPHSVADADTLHG